MLRRRVLRLEPGPRPVGCATIGRLVSSQAPKMFEVTAPRCGIDPAQFPAYMPPWFQTGSHLRIALRAVRGRGRLGMLVTLMKAKLHRATVTQADLEYEGSIAIDRDLLDASGILAHEQVDVLNITTGARFTTYAIEAPRGSRVVGVNGAAARLVQKGDKVIVVTYGMLPSEEARNYAPTVVLLDEGNEIKKAA
jgi:aspartate 1-decarboxylase